MQEVINIRSRVYSCGGLLVQIDNIIFQFASSNERVITLKGQEMSVLFD